MEAKLQYRLRVYGQLLGQKTVHFFQTLTLNAQVA